MSSIRREAEYSREREPLEASGWRERWSVWLRLLAAYIAGRTAGHGARLRALLAGAPAAGLPVLLMIAASHGSRGVGRLESSRPARRWLGLRSAVRTTGMTAAQQLEFVRLAMSLGDRPRAASLLVPMLGPGAGDPRAHRLAGQLLLTHREQAGAGTVAIRYLRQALSRTPDDELRDELGAALAAAGRPGEAADVLAPLTPRRPELHARVVCLRWHDAQAHQRLDPVEAARRLEAVQRLARLALPGILAHVRRTPSVPPRQRLEAAAALVLAGRPTEVVGLIGEPFEATAAHLEGTRRRCLARSLVARSQAASGDERRRLLERGLALAPSSVPVLDALDRAARSADGAWARTLLTEMERTEGADLAGLQAFWARSAWLRGERTRAIALMERALRGDHGRRPAITNNLAFMLASVEPPALDRALALVTSALKAVPDKPEFRHTHGVILLKLGRFREAATELTVALPFAADPPDAHRLLARCYRGMGLDQMAERHVARARELDTASNR